MLLLSLWHRFGPKRLAWDLALTGVAAALLSQIELHGDLVQGISAFAPEGYEDVLARVAAVVASTCIPVASWLGARLSTGRARYLVMLAALALGFGHQFVLPNLYPAIHVYIMWTAAAALAPALAPMTRRLVDVVPSLARRIALGVVAVVIAIAVMVPSGQAMSEMLRVPGSVWAPAASRFVSPQVYEGEFDLERWQPWLTPRASSPDAMPARGTRLPDNTIVLFIIVDALRADVLQPPDDAPLEAMRRLRDEGVSFAHAWSPAPATMEARAAIFTGKYTMQIGWKKPRKKRKGKRQKRLRPDYSTAPRFVERLVEKRGISEVNFNEYKLKRKPTDKRKVADTVAREVTAWLDKIPSDKGAFAYIHFYEPHSPYNRAGKDGTPKERYLREVELVDDAIGTILGAVDSGELRKRTLVLLTADHGEAFGEHNSSYHGVTVYNEVTRVPFIFYGPWFEPRVVDNYASLIDIAPTLLDLYGLPSPGSMMGQSLSPLLQGRYASLSRPLFIDSQGKDRALIFPDGIKLILRHRGKLFEVYDLKTDMKEESNIADTLDDTAGRRAVFERFVKAHTYAAP
jgi:hypothetical protein